MSDSKIKLTFYGGVEEVTGANFLLEVFDGKKNRKIIVDCGLSQGSKFADEKNREDFPYKPSDIDIILVTHAHIDHLGRVPKLVRDGFKGKIISTPQTMELAPIMLEDTQKILEEDAKKDGVLPIYERKDIAETVLLWEGISYGEQKEIFPGIFLIPRDAGHVLGSAMYEIFVGNKDSSLNGEKVTKIVFTGDLGNSPSPFLRDTEKIMGADYLIMESVYGDRNHESIDDRRNYLKEAVLKAIKKGGTILIPAFSLEKTQVLLSELNELVESEQIPTVPVFLDSPLAIKLTNIYKKNSDLFNEKTKEDMKKGDDIFRFPKLRFTVTQQESESIYNVKNPKIIIAGSGMSTGGRITKHERIYLGDPRNTIIFVGYQSAGCLGRQIEEGIKSVQIQGERINVRAEVIKINGYSSHKDMDHLIEFVDTSASTLKKVFVVMGEPRASFFLANRLRDYLGVEAIHPEEGETVELS